jgi:glutamate-1-semialdehyde 2,1-aminomutase
MNILAIVQARLGSKRFPKKVLQKLGDKVLIELLLERLAKSKLVNKIIVATTINIEDFELVKFVEDLGYTAYVGSENDVLDRYYQIAKSENPDIIVRITGDCPFVDATIVDEVINELILSNSDYTSNTQPPTFPDGMDVEAFRFDSLEFAWKNAKLTYDREHVTPYFYNNSDLFRISIIKNQKDYSNIRLTVDEKVDLNVLNKIFYELNQNSLFSWHEIIKLLDNKPELFMENNDIIRNEGANLGSGQKLWKRAKSIIPGGNMLLSKRSEMFLPDFWPSYFSKSKGCSVWDLDGKEYLDMSIMGIGTNTLGYGNDEVDSVVMNVIKSGNMSTLNCPEEVYLAEKLVEIHPWAEMVKFTRSGGEANAVALRIARAASGKDNVAICGYHGWHDWYLAANLESSKELNGHLLPGLEPKGVPQALIDTTFTFNYNDIETLKKLVKEKNIGVIFMEVMRNFEPEDNFLQKVRKLATENNIVLIFDECTSGFRETYGGLHLKYDVKPDIAMFGKALGNGYAINAIIGKREIMEHAQATFISSTFWTERIGPAAAVKTLDVMKKYSSWEVITKIGNEVSKNWKSIANENKLDISISGLPALSSFNFNSTFSLEYKTYVTQEMLKKGILASNAFYACTEHKKEYLDMYFNELNEIFSFISIHQGDIINFIDGKICHGGFKRLN